MPYHLFQGGFTPQNLGGTNQQTADRETALRPTLERLGGRLVAYYLALG